MRHIQSSIIRTAVVAGILVLSGCGASPMAPEAVTPSGPGPATAMAASPAVVAGLSVKNPVPIPPAIVGPLTLRTTVKVNGNFGGVVSLARVTVRVPAGAFPGAGNITVTIPDPAKSECQLSISPASKNHFTVPVVLEFDVTNSPEPRGMVVLWLDESANRWVPISCVADAGSKRLSAELEHFSTYKADTELVRKSAW